MRGPPDAPAELDSRLRRRKIAAPVVAPEEHPGGELARAPRRVHLQLERRAVVVADPELNHGSGGDRRRGAEVVVDVRVRAVRVAVVSESRVSSKRHRETRRGGGPAREQVPRGVGDGVLVDVTTIAWQPERGEVRRREIPERARFRPALRLGTVAALADHGPETKERVAARGGDDGRRRQRHAGTLRRAERVAYRGREDDVPVRDDRAGDAHDSNDENPGALPVAPRGFVAPHLGSPSRFPAPDGGDGRERVVG